MAKYDMLSTLKLGVATAKLFSGANALGRVNPRMPIEAAKPFAMTDTLSGNLVATTAAVDAAETIAKTVNGLSVPSSVLEAGKAKLANPAVPTEAVGVPSEKFLRAVLGHCRALESVAAFSKATEGMLGVSSRAADLWGATSSAKIITDLGAPLRVMESTAPWARLAEISRELLGQLDSNGEFDDESTIWLPDDEDVSEDALKQLMVPNRSIPVVEGTIQLAAMAALLRDPSLFRELHDRQFELVVAELLTTLGYQDILLTPRSGDGGKDVVAHRMIAGRPSVVYFECKHYRNRKIGRPEVMMLFGTICSDAVPQGVMVTSGRHLTKGGVELVAKHSDRLDAKVYDDLVGWVKTYARNRRGV